MSGSSVEETSLLLQPNADKLTRYDGTSERSEDTENIETEITSLDEDDECSTITCCNKIFDFISAVSIGCQVCMLIGQIIPALYFHIDPLQILLRIYVGFFCLFCIGLEAEWILKDTKMSHFISRGILYSFIGLVGVEQSVAIRVDMILHLDHAASVAIQSAVLFIHIASWAETTIGYFYFVMGIFCMKAMRDQVRMKKIERSAIKENEKDEEKKENEERKKNEIDECTV